MYLISFSLLVIDIAPFKMGTFIPLRDYTLCTMLKTVRKIYLHKKYTITKGVKIERSIENERVIKRR